MSKLESRRVRKTTSRLCCENIASENVGEDKNITIRIFYSRIISHFLDFRSLLTSYDPLVHYIQAKTLGKYT